jgi:hypothetical protein
MKIMIKQKGVIILLLILLSISTARSQSDFIWGKQSGSNREEYVLNHVTDRNKNIYVTGKTTGVISKQNLGRNDGFIIKIDSLNNTIWSRQFGTSEEEDILWSAIDDKGCVYITGSTRGDLSGKNSGKEDIFVVKYNPEGQLQWTKQFGTDSTDIANGIYADTRGYVFITGTTKGILGKSSFGKTDGFIMKLDANGQNIFTNQFGTAGDDYSLAVTGDGDTMIFVCGSTWGDIGAKNSGMLDAFTGSFNDKGEIIKFTQFGTGGFDMALQLTTDDKKNLYIGGSTSGDLAISQIGDGDCFLTKINSKGDIVWSTQFGTKNHDGVRGIAFNRNVSDNILVSGIMHLAPSYAFIRMYKPDGNLLWERNFSARGANSGTSGKDVTLDDDGNIYHLGLTAANLFGTLSGESDFYLVKLGLDRIYMNSKK